MGPVGLSRSSGWHYGSMLRVSSTVRFDGIMPGRSFVRPFEFGIGSVFCYWTAPRLLTGKESDPYWYTVPSALVVLC